MEDKVKKITEKIGEAVNKLNKKDFTIYFFVIDTKGVPNGSTQYIYETAKDLIDGGFKCSMLHQEKEFVGVIDWLGEDYSSIPHACIENENIQVSTSDFLVIPEIFANVMGQTKDLPCKRIILCQNINYVTEFIPLGVSWLNYGILDVITTSETQADDIKKLFPYVNTKIISPAIPDYFRDNGEPKKLMVSIVAKDQTYINKIVKQFHWKFPQYRWVTFTDLRGLNREIFADTLRESAFTIWIDEDSYFGYTPIEAMKSGSIVIGKIPNVIPEWMYNDEKTDVKSNGLWFDDFRDIHKIIAQGIKLWLEDNIPDFIFEEMGQTAKEYTLENKQKQLSTVFDELIKERIVELNEVKTKFEQKNK